MWLAASLVGILVAVVAGWVAAMQRRNQQMSSDVCSTCGHDGREHMSPTLDLGLPYGGDMCQMGDCPCREFRALGGDYAREEEGRDDMATV